jgi:hypothetical protein
LLGEFLRGRVPLFFYFAGVVGVALCVYALLLYLLKVELFIEAMERGLSWLKRKRNNA